METNKTPERKQMPAWVFYGLTGLSCALMFVLIYGARILNPVYTDWLLMGEEDLRQHYLGWRAFRSTPWMFPIGMTDVLVHPFRSSVIYTDSIPLVAVPLKLFSRWLPEPFQYFGLWGLACFFLQGMIASRILDRYCSRAGAYFLALLTALSPAVLQRMYYHTTLAGHWLLLLALEMIFVPGRFETKGARMRRAALLGFLGGSLHIYLLLMCGIILVGFCLLDVLKTKKLGASVAMLVVFVASAGAVIAILGGFSMASSASQIGLGELSMNLNAFVNPQGFSRFLPDLPTMGPAQHEGFNYLGLGGLVLLALAAVLLLAKPEVRKKVWTHRFQVLALFAVAVIAAVIALSPVISLNDKVLFQIPLKQRIENLWAIFRSTGRIGWIIGYILLLSAGVVLGRRLPWAVLALLFVLQCLDLQPVITQKHEHFANPLVYRSSIEEDPLFAAAAADPDIRHILFAYQDTYAGNYPMADYCLNHGKTLNQFCVSRFRNELGMEYVAGELADPKKDELFLFRDNQRLSCFVHHNLHFYAADRFTVGSVRELEGFEELTGFSQEWHFGGNLYIDQESGYDTESGRVIHPGKRSNGPFWEVNPGTFLLEVTGEGLVDLEVQTVGAYGTLEFPCETEEQDDGKIRAVVTIGQAEPFLEIYLTNGGGQDILVHGIRMTLLEEAQ